MDIHSSLPLSPCLCTLNTLHPSKMGKFNSKIKLFQYTCRIRNYSGYPCYKPINEPILYIFINTTQKTDINSVGHAFILKFHIAV